MGVCVSSDPVCFFLPDDTLVVEKNFHLVRYVCVCAGLPNSPLEEYCLLHK